MGQRLVRFENWPTLLSDFIDRNRDHPFVWGEWDCVLSAMASVEAITGVDVGAPYRGRYSTPIGAARVIREVGGAGLVEALKVVFGEPLPTPSLVSTGDLALKETELGPALGICVGPRFAFATSPAGWAFTTDRPLVAWRI